MVDNDIAINDLYAEVLPHVEKLQREDGCHFTREGYAYLAQQVAESVIKQGRLFKEGDSLMVSAIR